MLARCLLLLLALFPAAAEARPRAADLAVQGVSATSSGEVRFTIVNRGGTRAPAASVRAEIGTTSAAVKQRALRPRARVRHVVRVADATPGSWRVRVCVRPARRERTRGNDCASAAKRLTIPTPTFVNPASERILGAPGDSSAPVVAAARPDAAPAPTATSTPTASPFPTDAVEVATSYQQSSAHDGRIRGTAPAAPLGVAWRKDLGGHPAYPVIAEGRVFVVTDEAVLHALDLRNGATLYSRPIGQFGGTVTYDAGRLFVTDGKGLMFAIDADTGLTLWSRGVPNDGPPLAANGKVYLSSALVIDGATGDAVNSFMSWQEDSETAPVLDGTRLYYGGKCGATAVTLSTWKRAWHSDYGNSCEFGLVASTGHGRLYNPSQLFDEPGTIHDAATGSVLGHFPAGITPALTDDGAALIVADDVLTAQGRWTFRADSPIRMAPIVSATHAYVRSSTALHAVELTTGQETARVPLDQPQWLIANAGLAAAHGTVLTSAGTELVAVRNASAPAQPGSPELTPAPLDLGAPAPAPGASPNLQIDAAHTGGINLATPAPPLAKRWAIPVRTRSPRLADGRVFFIDEQAGTLRAVDAHTGAPLWSTPAGRANLSPAYDQGRVFTSHPDGLSAYSAATGQLLWRNTFSSEAWLSAPPTADDGAVYMNHGGSIVAYDGATGTRLWSRFLDDSLRGAVSLDATRVLTGPYCAPLDRATGAPAGDPEDPNCSDGSFTHAPFAHGQLIETDTSFGAFDVARRTYVASAAAETPPAILGNVAVTGTANGLRAYTLPEWTPRWQYVEQARERPSVPPVIVGRTVYAVNTGGILRAYDLDTGAVRWSGRPSEYELGPAADHNQAAMAAGEGLLIVPAATELVAFGGT